MLGAHGQRLKLALAAPALDGKANAALLRILAERLGVPQRQLTLVAGAASRQKTVRVACAQQDLPVLIERLQAGD